MGINTLALSADGAALAFSSSSSDLVAGDFNSTQDVFLASNPAPGSAYFTLPPCRLFDSRQSGPALVTGSPVTLAAHGVCGIPASARALAVNLTVTQPTGSGYITLNPTDAALPATSNLNYTPGQTRSNNGVLQLSFDGLGHLDLSPFTGGGGTVHVVVDVMGYFE